MLDNLTRNENTNLHVFVDQLLNDDNFYEVMKDNGIIAFKNDGTCIDFALEKQETKQVNPSVSNSK